MTMSQHWFLTLEIQCQSTCFPLASLWLYRLVREKNKDGCTVIKVNRPRQIRCFARTCANSREQGIFGYTCIKHVTLSLTNRQQACASRGFVYPTKCSKRDFKITSELELAADTQRRFVRFLPYHSPTSTFQTLSSVIWSAIFVCFL